MVSNPVLFLNRFLERKRVPKWTPKSCFKPICLTKLCRFDFGPFSILSTVPHDAPRSPQDASKTSPRRSKTLQDGPKLAPDVARNRARWPVRGRSPCEINFVDRARATFGEGMDPNDTAPTVALRARWPDQVGSAQSADPFFILATPVPLWGLSGTSREPLRGHAGATPGPLWGHPAAQERFRNH